MSLRIFCGLYAQKFWRVRTFSKNSPRIKAVMCPKLGEDQKKGLLAKMERCCVRNYVKTKKRRRSSA